MAFYCDKCGKEAPKVKVGDWVKELETKCECGGTYKKS